MRSDRETYQLRTQMASSVYGSVPPAGGQINLRSLRHFYEFEVSVEPHRLSVRNLAPSLYPGIPAEFVQTASTVKLVISAADLVFLCVVLIVGDRSRAERCGLAIPIWRVRRLKRELERCGYEVEWSLAIKTRLELDD